MRAVYEEIVARCERVKQRTIQMSTQQKFRTELFKTFDEMGSAESLEKFANRCDRVRALFVGGDPIDDLEDSATLAELATELYVELKEDCRKVLGVEFAIFCVTQFARYKALGKIARINGRVNSALRYENAVESYYGRLSSEWKW